MTATNLVRLNTLTADVEDLKSEFSEYKQSSGRKIAVLRALLATSEAEMEELKERVAFFEEDVLGVEEQQHEEETVAEEDEAMGEGIDHGGRAHRVVAAAGVDVKKESEIAKKSKPIKDVINSALRHLMGTEKLDGPSLPPYPYQIGREHTLWPKDLQTGNPLLRFNWPKPYGDPSNAPGLATIFAHIRSMGVAMVPEAKQPLATILDDDLKERICLRYNYLSKLRKEALKKQEDLAERQRREEELDDQAIEEMNDIKLLKRSQKNSRAEAILNARKRKRVKSEYTDPKYDSAFILNAMSDYEDDPDRRPDEATYFIRRAPDYRSEEVVKLYEEIDKIPDPVPDKEKAIKTRRNGPNINGAEPPVARNLANRIRAWQVKPEILEKNPHWMGTRIAMSGIAWGDAEDPQDEKTDRKRGGIMEDPKVKKIRRLNSAGGKRVEKANEKLASLLGDGELENMFD
ncbi:hypothetical protein Hypma_013500 [Hypsizygus marmoreus]|uniref:Uncharacterized protein n=1 Tax=Hypsizygus marmoreus TaxID=39966 RepID=A0A369JE11_HYPMA|nr:hypothetical protein Hypma_013500 [Hypsizygus marmoreus]